MPRPKTYATEHALHACMQVFWQHGYARSSMRQLEQATGLSAGSLYHAFGSKEQLYQQALEHYLNTVINTRITRHLQRHASIVEGIEQFLTSVVHADWKLAPLQSCLLVNSAAELGQEKPDIGITIQAGFRRIHQALKTAIQRAQQCEELNAQLDPDLLARQLGLILPGLLLAKRNGASAEGLISSIEALLTPWRLQPTRALKSGDTP